MDKIRIMGQKALNLFRKIWFRLIASFMVPVAFIILLGVLSFLKASDGITNNYEKSTSQALNMAGKYLEFGFESVISSANQYVNDDSVRKYYTGFYESNVIEKTSKLQELKNNLGTKQTVDKFISEIYLISDTYGSISTRAVHNDTYHGFLDTELGNSVIENPLDYYWLGSDEYLDEKLNFGSDKYAMRLVRSVWRTDAIIIIDVSMDAVQDVLRNLEFDKTGIVGFVTADGKEIIATAASGKVEVSLANEPVFTDNEFYHEAINGEASEGAKSVQYNKESYMFMYSKIGETGAMICGLVPKKSIMSQADSIKNMTLIVALISIIVAIGIAVIISSDIDKTIKSIISKLRIAAKGDLTVEFNIKRKDEFKTLIDEIQLTFTNMKNLIQQVKERSKEVSVSSEEVIKTTNEFLKATQEISYAINEIESGVMQQAKDAEECLSQMDYLSQKILSVSESTKEISNIADNTKQSIQEGTVTTEELNTQTKETGRIAAEIINEIQNLEKKSSSIDDIIEVISEIADQTNLLSLNASIEAARAGEAGKGFAVVATEIRALADRSKESINNIKSIIEGIQSDTKKAVNIAREVENVMHMQESAVSNTTKSYMNINESVENLVVYLKQIVENVDTIDDARVSTLGAIESISAVLEEIAASSNTVNQSASEQLSAVETLNNSADNLNNSAEVLEDAVDKFKV